MINTTEEKSKKRLFRLVVIKNHLNHLVKDTVEDAIKRETTRSATFEKRLSEEVVQFLRMQ